MTEPGLIRQISATGGSQKLARQVDRLREAGVPESDYDFDPSSNRLRFCGRVWPMVMRDTLKVRLQYDVAYVAEQSKSDGLTWQIPLGEERSIAIRRSPVYIRPELSAAEGDAFGVLVTEATGNECRAEGAQPASALPDSLREYEWIEAGLPVTPDRLKSLRA